MRQLLLFGIPAAILTTGAVTAWSRDPVSYIDHMYNAHALDRDGRSSEAVSEARLAFEAMRSQLPIERKLTEIQPTAAREAALAFLVYNHARYENVVMPSLNGEAPRPERQARYIDAVTEAIVTMERALARNAPLHHAGRESLTPDDARRAISGWQTTIQNYRGAP